jgi:CDP-glycerol glycerophosphotransferase (TagB/SpsB family)
VIGKEDVLVNNLYLNICQTVFSENEMIKSIESRVLINKGRNQIVVGYLNADHLIGEREEDSSLWKKSSKEIRKIIWAPHHSILEHDILNYSNFLNIADDMLQLARDYQDKVEFVFKPHPGLKPKLYDLDGWGKERTDNYYSEWASMPNTTLGEGSYEGLFRSSDAMIHDSSSFTVEYLYTGKPVMYMSKADHLDYMNSFGKVCYDMHYKGFSIDDVRSFIDNVVIGGKDIMMEKRESFVKNCLRMSNGCGRTADIIKNHIVDLCFKNNDL